MTRERAGDGAGDGRLRGPFQAASARVRRVRADAAADPAGVAGRVGLWLGLVLVGSGFLVPLYWLLTAGLGPPGAIGYPPALVPPALTGENLATVATETRFVRVYLPNSLLVSVATAAATVAVATPAGYALARLEVPRTRTVLLGLLLVQMLPVVALIVPVHGLFATLGLLDTLLAIVLADTALAVPVAVWVTERYYAGLPAHLEEAALVGGGDRFRAFLAVAPLGRPAVAAAALYAFVLSWNQFVVPLTLASRPATWTVPVGLYAFVAEHGVVRWELLGAASLLAVVPLLALLAVGGRLLATGVGGGVR